MDAAKVLFYSFAAALLLTAFAVASIILGTVTAGTAFLTVAAGGGRPLGVMLASCAAALIVGGVYTWRARANKMPRPGLLSYLNLCLTAWSGTAFGLWLADQLPAAAQGPLAESLSAGALCLAPVLALLQFQLVDLPFPLEATSSDSDGQRQP